MCRRKLLATRDLERMLRVLKTLLPNVKPKRLHSVLTQAFTAPWSDAQLAVLAVHDAQAPGKVRS